MHNAHEDATRTRTTAVVVVALGSRCCTAAPQLSSAPLNSVRPVHALTRATGGPVRRFRGNGRRKLRRSTGASRTTSTPTHRHAPRGVTARSRP
eukprot:scaffold48478_cov146-Isochrysis_galbana.AAC.1